jgi:hypothetical protein
MPAQAAINVVGPVTQASSSNGSITPTTSIAHPSPLPQGQDNARLPLVIPSRGGQQLFSFYLQFFFH